MIDHSSRRRKVRYEYHDKEELSRKEIYSGSCGGGNGIAPHLGAQNRYSRRGKRQLVAGRARCALTSRVPQVVFHVYSLPSSLLDCSFLMPSGLVSTAFISDRDCSHRAHTICYIWCMTPIAMLNTQDLSCSCVCACVVVLLDSEALLVMLRGSILYNIHYEC